LFRLTARSFEETSDLAVSQRFPQNEVFRGPRSHHGYKRQIGGKGPLSGALDVLRACHRGRPQESFSGSGWESTCPGRNPGWSTPQILVVVERYLWRVHGPDVSIGVWVMTQTPTLGFQGHDPDHPSTGSEGLWGHALNPMA